MEKNKTTMKQKIKTFYVRHKETILVATLLGGSTVFYRLALKETKGELNNLKARPILDVDYDSVDPSIFHASIGHAYIGSGKAETTEQELKDKYGIVRGE